MKQPCTKIACALATTLACGAASADSNFNMPEGSKDISVAATVFDAPRSEGGTRRQVGVLPSFSGRWSNGIFASLGTVGWDVSDDPVLDYGPVISYDLRQRRTDDSSDRVGGLDVEGGLFAQYMFTYDIHFSTELMYGGGADRSGIRLVAAGEYSLRLGPHASLSLSPGFEMANASYMKSTFGVTPAQSAVDHLAPYETHAGVKNLFLGTSVAWQASNKWTLMGGVHTSLLLGTAAHSPLTQKRADSTLFLSGSYHF